MIKVKAMAQGNLVRMKVYNNKNKLNTFRKKKSKSKKNKELIIAF